MLSVIFVLYAHKQAAKFGDYSWRIYNLFISAASVICYIVSVKKLTAKGGIIMTDNINKTIDNEELDLEQLENVSGGDGHYPAMGEIVQTVA